MDISDPDIEFDNEGVCSHCKKYDNSIKQYVYSGKEGELFLNKEIEKIKESGQGKEYDCLIGLSGGVDSSYVAYQVVKQGLRPLAVHLDNGWDSELAVSNILKLVEKLDIDFYTYVIDWDEFRDLQTSFLLASTPDSEVPTDHAIVSLMFQIADKYDISYVISGRNYRTESHGVAAWSRGHYDWKYISSVQKIFGKKALNTYPHRTPNEEINFLKKQIWFDILNYVDYSKKDAIGILEKEIGWRPYGEKHYESIYTRFFQGYILPKKFGYDKRKSHYSSLICSGELSREDALDLLKNEPYDIALQEEDKKYVIQKLGLTQDEFEEIMNLPIKTIFDYPSYARDGYPVPFSIARILKKIKNRMFLPLRVVYKILN